MEIIDSYLEESEFENIYQRVHDHCWILVKALNKNAKSEEDFQLIHYYVNDCNATYENAGEIPSRVMTPYAHSNNISKILFVRARSNLFVRTSSVAREMGYHRDIEDSEEVMTLLLYLEDSDGGTQFKETGEKVLSKRNRAVVFPAHVEHQTVSATNVLFRSNVNINFIYNDWI